MFSDPQLEALVKSQHLERSDPVIHLANEEGYAGPTSTEFLTLPL